MAVEVEVVDKGGSSGGPSHLQPMKWWSGVPSCASLKRLVPSGITPWPCVPRILGHRFVFVDMQKMQSSSPHCGV